MRTKREFYKTFYDLPNQTSPVMAQVFGAIYRFCEMRDGICYASKETLGELTGYNRKTVRENIAKLIDDGWIEDRTPDIKFRPHTYAITEQAREFLDASGTLAPDSGTFGTSSDTLSITEWYSRYHKEREYKRDIKRESAEFFNSVDGTQRLLDSLIYIQEYKRQLLTDIIQEEENTEYVSMAELERAVDTVWDDTVYYHLDGRKVEAGDLVNRQNIMELATSPAIAFVPVGFFESYYRGLNG